MAGEVLGGRRNRDRAAKPRRLQRILSAAGCDQAAADEYNLSKPIPQPELIERIGDPDAFAWRRLAIFAARGAEKLGDFDASFGMPRGDDGQQTGMRRA